MSRCVLALHVYCCCFECWCCDDWWLLVGYGDAALGSLVDLHGPGEGAGRIS